MWQRQDPPLRTGRNEVSKFEHERLFVALILWLTTVSYHVDLVIHKSRGHYTWYKKNNIIETHQSKYLL